MKKSQHVPTTEPCPFSVVIYRRIASFLYVDDLFRLGCTCIDACDAVDEDQIWSQFLEYKEPAAQRKLRSLPVASPLAAPAASSGGNSTTPQQQAGGQRLLGTSSRTNNNNDNNNNRQQQQQRPRLIAAPPSNQHFRNHDLSQRRLTEIELAEFQRRVDSEILHPSCIFNCDAFRAFRARAFLAFDPTYATMMLTLEDRVMEMFRSYDDRYFRVQPHGRAGRAAAAAVRAGGGGGGGAAGLVTNSSSPDAVRASNQRLIDNNLPVALVAGDFVGSKKLTQWRSRVDRHIFNVMTICDCFNEMLPYSHSTHLLMVFMVFVFGFFAMFIVHWIRVTWMQTEFLFMPTGLQKMLNITRAANPSLQPELWFRFPTPDMLLGVCAFVATTSTATNNMGGNNNNNFSGSTMTNHTMLSNFYDEEENKAIVVAIIKNVASAVVDFLYWIVVMVVAFFRSVFELLFLTRSERNKNKTTMADFEASGSGGLQPEVVKREASALAMRIQNATSTIAVAFLNFFQLDVLQNLSDPSWIFFTAWSFIGKIIYGFLYGIYTLASSVFWLCHSVFFSIIRILSPVLYEDGLIAFLHDTGRSILTLVYDVVVSKEIYHPRFWWNALIYPSMLFLQLDTLYGPLLDPFGYLSFWKNDLLHTPPLTYHSPWTLGFVAACACVCSLVTGRTPALYDVPKKFRRRLVIERLWHDLVSVVSSRAVDWSVLFLVTLCRIWFCFWRDVSLYFTPRFMLSFVEWVFSFHISSYSFEVFPIVTTTVNKLIGVEMAPFVAASFILAAGFQAVVAVVGIGSATTKFDVKAVMTARNAMQSWYRRHILQSFYCTEKGITSFSYPDPTDVRTYSSSKPPPSRQSRRMKNINSVQQISTVMPRPRLSDSYVAIAVNAFFYMSLCAMRWQMYCNGASLSRVLVTECLVRFAQSMLESKVMLR